MKKLILFILITLFLFGCSDDPSGNDLEEIEFGASYRLIQDEELPQLFDRILTVRVGYSGCEGAHEFTLRSRINGADGEMWLFKETRDQPCDAFFNEVLSFQVPNDVFTSQNVVLITPELERIMLER
ncbi:MAG: hypothetical protein GVY02_05915 [Bacteroidetes bacterium]|jgi:hypothetical protein|nr:hypothetical protein [Bacteroidota bacterium]